MLAMNKELSISTLTSIKCNGVRLPVFSTYVTRGGQTVLFFADIRG
jgi:hypothetical protein